MADFTRIKYGQVEPNQLSAQRTGEIYASLPLDTEVAVLQNGEFMYYDYANGTVNAGKTAGASNPATGMTEPYLVFNEVKLYDGWRESYKDFAMIRVGDNYVTTDLATAGYGDGATTVGNVPSTTKPPSAVNSTGHTEYGYRMDGFAPRMFKTNIGDIYTTNMVKTGVEYAVGDILVPVKNNTTKTLQLEKAGATPTGMQWQVVKVYHMADGQPGLKLQRIA